MDAGKGNGRTHKLRLRESCPSSRLVYWRDSFLGSSSTGKHPVIFIHICISEKINWILSSYIKHFLFGSLIIAKIAVTFPVIPAPRMEHKEINGGNPVSLCPQPTAHRPPPAVHRPQPTAHCLCQQSVNRFLYDKCGK